jgi:hypothetical protein
MSLLSFSSNQLSGKVVQTIRYKDPSTHNPRVWFQFVAKVSYVVVIFREVPHYTLLSRRNVSRERIDRSRHRALRLGMHSRVRFVTNLREFGVISSQSAKCA